MDSQIKITIFGLGFVGLTTAVGFAKKGFQTYGYEILPQKVEQLQNAKIPFYEEGLQEAFNEVYKQTLFITNDISQALKDSDVIFYCIGTPMDDDGSADLSYILQALEQTAKNIHLCKKQPILVIKSTVPPSSCSECFVPFLNDKLGIKTNQDSDSLAFLINNPEFLREGSAYKDFMHPDRIVIGTSDAKEIEKIKQIYTPFNAPILFSTLNTAEFIKYLSNTMLAVNIGFANEMSMIAQNIGDIDIKKSFEILHQDKRFHGNPAGIASYIYPGLGFGGYCLPKDTLALHKKAKEKNFDAKILQSTLKTNDEILEFYVQKISSEVPKDKKLCILGLSFKPNSDDVRDSKSAALIKGLLQAGYSNIIAYDPMAIEVFKNTYNLNINYAKNLQEAIKDSIIIIATAWEDFRDILNQDNIYNLRFM